MMDPPKYPDHPIPSWEDFQQDYGESFFDESADVVGKNYIILVDNIEVGTIGYDNLDVKKGCVDFDIWLRAEKYCGHGYGSDAINSLVMYLHHKYGVSEFRLDPSRRNVRAINVYKKWI